MSLAFLGMLWFLFSESFFFVFLLVAYISFHADSGRAPIRGDLDVWRTGIFTLLLISSSFTAWRAHVAVVKKRARRFQGWILLTIALGGAFIWGQASEYFRLFEKEITISRDPLATSFFTVTGFHGLHVCAGLLLLILLLLWSFLQTRSGREVPLGAVEGISLYWHFVDLVWIAVFSIVYLWGAT